MFQIYVGKSENTQTERVWIPTDESETYTLETWGEAVARLIEISQQNKTNVYCLYNTMSKYPTRVFASQGRLVLLSDGHDSGDEE